MLPVRLRRTLLAAAAAAGTSLAVVGAPSAAVAPVASTRPAEAPAPSCLDLSCLTPMTEQARLAQFAGIQATRMSAETATGLRAGIEAKSALAAGPAVPGTNGTWKPLGVGPLVYDDPQYTATYGNGFADVAGRISDFAYSPTTKQLWATAAQGGVWESNDTGNSWRSIGDGLPFQSVGGIAWTRAGGPKGTLMVLTGDHAFSNDYAGLGAYWTTDGGATWNRARGIPDGALSFRIAVDPTKPEVAYAATGFGVYRTADAGRSWTNVRLPTGPCTGNSQAKDCFFANIATDVAVQGADTFGNKGGAVVAALGWRAGRYPNFNGKPQAPYNGVYRSETGAVGSFTMVPDSAGITASKDFGRAEFGPTTGAGQNSAYLYAIVQNATYFTSGQDPLSNSINGDPLGVGINPLAKTSDLDGIYVSPDFGKTWRLMSNAEQMKNPANGSSLNQLRPLGISAGYQVTYNQWIRPDPTRTINGVPSRLAFGMEEIWTNQVPQPLDGSGETTTAAGRQGGTTFTTIGAYNQAGACLLVAAAPTCSQARVPDNPLQTTTHPDQHGGIFIPNEGTGVTLVVGNDGGVYRQSDDTGVSPFTQQGFGRGAQTGFHTLLPYGIAMAKDGTAYMGLQDNGEAKIDKDTGKQYAVYGGDGVFTVVDPDNSDIVYEEYPGARVSLSTDGGKTFTAITPSFVTDADFVTPLVMDPTNAKHVVTGGRQIAETTVGEATTGSSGWKNVFDLGVQSSPGEGGKATATDPANHVVSLAVNGPNVYAGFCGSCDPVKLHQKFRSGLATNVGGAEKPQSGTDSGWHIAKAKGLPQRFITSLTMDPKNPRTVYATLGASAARYWAPIGALGEDASAAAGGYVYKSTDAGETFTDITGDLPKVQATWSVVRGGQLLVANAVGVFASNGTSGGHYAPLGGKTLPTAAVFMMQLKPGDPNTLVAASFGRGGYTYQFPAGAQLPPDSPPPGGKGNGGGGNLAATGFGIGVPVTAVLLLGVAAVLRRRRIA